jgi:Ca-activated chloride channel family protein
LAFLIDVSGSMQDPLKLPLVKKLLMETLEMLDPEDRVSVVTYASGTRVALPSTLVAERATLEAVISDLSPSGATNGAGGIQLAYREVRSEWIEGGVNHVVLCTDGDFNVGVSSTTELVKLIEDERESGVTFTAVGFGAGPNDAMLEEISNHGNGIYGAVGTQAQAEEYAHERMLSTLYHVAKDMKIQVEFNPELVWAYRLLGYENRAIADDDFRDDAVDAGEVGAGHRVTALYELAFDESGLPAGIEVGEGSTSELTRKIGAEDLVQVRVRYKEVGASEDDAAFEVVRALPESALTKPDLDLAWAGAVAEFAELLKESPTANRALLSEIAAVIEAQAGRDAERDEFIELFQQARPLLEAR